MICVAVSSGVRVEVSNHQAHRSETMVHGSRQSLVVVKEELLALLSDGIAVSTHFGTGRENDEQDSPRAEGLEVEVELFAIRDTPVDDGREA